MSRFEQEEFINDRYKAIEDRLAVREAAPLPHAANRAR